MASVSPALHASRPGELIDPQRQAEYPILLGDSLQDVSPAKVHFFNLQYNWKPKNPPLTQRGVITKADPPSSGDAPYQLTISQPGPGSKSFKYAGSLRSKPVQSGSTKLSPEEQTTSLALVFNQEKSAFVLEKISATLDFNLTSAPGQSRAEIQAHRQLPSSKKTDTHLETVHKPASAHSDEEDEPDSANPYDYRHFLEEAKANAEKGLGSRTPIPGSLSGFPSPVPGPSRFGAGSRPGTPLHKPVTSAAVGPVKKRKVVDESQCDNSRSSTGTTHKATTSKPRQKPLSATTSKPPPLSKERISDSDEEIGDTITLSRPPTTKSSAVARPKKPASAGSKSKVAYAPSPRIEVDEAADLVIDMGSPPPAARRRLGAGFASPFAIARPPPPATRGKSAARHGTSMLDSEEEDAEGEPDDDVDGDVLMRDADSHGDAALGGTDGDADADGDVEDLVLGSPRASTTRAPSVSVSRVGVGGEATGDEDEDDELAAELEAALENDDEDGDASGNDGGVGLGISTIGGGGGGGGREDEDESEVSEEE